MNPQRPAPALAGRPSAGAPGPMARSAVETNCIMRFHRPLWGILCCLTVLKAKSVSSTLFGLSTNDEAHHTLVQVNQTSGELTPVWSLAGDKLLLDDSAFGFSPEGIQFYGITYDPILSANASSW